MKKILIVSASALLLTACYQVKPGEVGLRIHQYGSNAGHVDVLSVGMYGPQWGTITYDFPISTQNYTFTKGNEQNAINEEFQFQDTSGLALAADIGANYSVDSEKTPILFEKYRALIASSKEPLDAIVSGPLRNEIRDSLIRHSSNLDISQINGAGRAALLQQVQTDVQAYFKPYGLNVERLFWAGQLRMPDAVQHQINTRISNEQAAKAAEAQVATVRAQAEQQVAEAEGKAKSLDVEGEAIRRNPEVLRIRAIEKWNGVMPTVVGGNGAMPFINVGGEK